MLLNKIGQNITDAGSAGNKQYMQIRFAEILKNKSKFIVKHSSIDKALEGLAVSLPQYLESRTACHSDTLIVDKENAAREPEFRDMITTLEVYCESFFESKRDGSYERQAIDNSSRKKLENVMISVVPFSTW
jgi:hypothetical protein